MMNSILGTIIGLVLSLSLIYLGYVLHDPIDGYIRVKKDFDRRVEIVNRNREVK